MRWQLRPRGAAVPHHGADGTIAQFSNATERWWHWATLLLADVDGAQVVVDWTARQFDPAAPPTDPATRHVQIAILIGGVHRSPTGSSPTLTHDRISMSCSTRPSPSPRPKRSSPDDA